MQAPDFFVRTKLPVQDSVFVLMPFSESLSNVYDHAIKPVVEQLGMSCKRADEIYSASSILSDVWGSIQTADIVIADLTAKNPNVMYELGLCHALWKQVILISQNRDDVPFDLKQWRVIWYDFTFAGAARLKEELTRAIVDMRKDPTIESKIIPLNDTVEPPLPLPPILPPPLPLWMTGRVDSWNEDKGYGFIVANGETFFFSKEYLFIRDFKIFVGESVVFKPKEKVHNTDKYRLASFLFVDGRHITGTIEKCLPERGFCFARVEGQHGQTHEMFLLTGKGQKFGIGQIVDFAVGGDNRGPVGRNTHVVADMDTDIHTDIDTQS